MSAVNEDLTIRYIPQQIIFVLKNITIVNKIIKKDTFTVYSKKMQIK